MRTVYWLFVVSVALFVSGIGFVIAGGRTVQVAAPADEAPGAAGAPVRGRRGGGRREVRKNWPKMNPQNQK